MGRITVEAPRTFDNDGLARQALRQAIAQRAARDGGMTVLDEGGPQSDATHALRLSISEPLRDPNGTAVRLVQVQLRAIGQGNDYVASSAVADVPSLLTLGVAGFEAALPTLAALRALDAASDAELLRAIASADVATREFAIQRVGERRLKEAVAPLTARLHDEPQPALVLKSVGALVAIGDPNAVPAIIDLSNRKDAATVTQVVFAVAALGGRTAEAFLTTLAGGHPDEVVRRGATDALQEMRRRRK